jgi:GMP synthase (glutamine-hydrolysing)
MSQTLAVLDFGSQYTQVITRRIRECHVYSQVFAHDVSAETLKQNGVSGIILSGGPSSVLIEGSPRPDPAIFDLGVPVLGICYGIQLLAHLLGGEVARSPQREFGKGMLLWEAECPLLGGLQSPLKVWNSHGDKLTRLPEGFEAVARTENSDYAVIQNLSRRMFGIQFHPEVAHTQQGVAILKNFLFGICGLKGDWKMASYVEAAVHQVREQVGNKRVILGLSGGVDSSVAAALLHRAIGDQLTCVFVDNGLLRAGERDKVEALFKGHFKIDLRVIDATREFLDELKDVSDPERKRKIIGRVFVEVFEAAIADLGEVEFLAQGTLYPDVIESVAIAGNPAALIKSHHNVGGLPERMKLKLLEPLRELFKDEVRALGLELGLPAEMIWRHPFPGPGLAVRVLGDIRNEYLEILRKADTILLEEIKSSGWYEKLWQAFCVFLPVRSVGVMGDERTYDYVIALRMVESQDAMTADWAHVPHAILQTISSRIINEVSGVNRVVLDISSKPPSTIEWE